ncbi:MAG: hypothetical protein F6J93_21105 [Oscillatoria sp. SIO1A7]|nr:hypothetical protein [Oscillatoria sp. SIO1A7]
MGKYGPIPNSQFPIPHTQFPMPNSQFPIPNSQFSITIQFPGLVDVISDRLS